MKMNIFVLFLIDFLHYFITLIKFFLFFFLLSITYKILRHYFNIFLLKLAFEIMIVYLSIK
jgi:hypothetical protein